MNFDHILLIGYGAPAKMEEVMPFLRSMNQGRNVSEECLKTVARHYEVIGGGSPYKAQIADFGERLEKELHAAGSELPVFMGMKNGSPFFKEVLTEIYQKGFRKGLAIPMTPYRFASSGAGYRDSLIRSTLGMKDLDYQFIEGWYDQELFVEAQAEEGSRALQTVTFAERLETPILFSFHSMPVSRDSDESIRLYAEEARAASALVAARLGHSKWNVVYQSRPLSAQGAWLGPEIKEEINVLAAKGEKRVLVVPLGFLCDHAEILYDLDQEARGIIENAGMVYSRAKTVLRHPRLVTLFRKLIETSL